MSLLQISEPGEEIETNDEDVIVGIDLGTTNSLVSIIEDGQVKILKDQDGQDVIPSIAKFKDVEIASIKRLMGKCFSEIDAASLEFDIAHEDGLKIITGAQKMSPEEISAQILERLKKIAEDNLGKPVKRAVITVPAYFDDNAKNATKLAANLAGLEVVRLLNEPTAAALAYGLENSSKGTYVIYDLGGGTFDVSILKMQKGVFKVLGVSGNNNLGGDDFDLEIIKKFPELAKSDAKKLKEQLTDSTFFSLGEFEALIADKISETITLTTNLLEDLDLEPEKIDGVILVGGSTRIRLIQRKLAEIFGQDKILTNLDPDRVVAMGAAHQANSLMGNSDNLLLDVNALSLGIEMMGGIVEKIIHRNSTIPTAYAKEFTTYADNQTGMKFHIVQGERELAKDCRSLANFEIKGIPPIPAGMAKVQITFKLDADGLLTVSGEEKTTGIKQEIEVKPSFSLDENQVKNMLLDSMKNSKSDIEERLLIEAATEAQQDVVIIEKDLKNNLVQGEEKEQIAEKLDILKKEIAAKNSRKNITLAQEELAKISENLVLSKVNKVLNNKISGKNIDDI